MSSQQLPGTSQQAAGTGGAALLSATLQQEVLGLTGRLLEEVARAVGERVLEEVEGRVREAVERETRALREDMRRMDEKVTTLEATLELRVQGIGERMSNQERDIRALEERLLQAERAQAERAAEREATDELSGKMERVEASLQRALTSTMPKVEALLAQLEAPTTSSASAAPSAASTSTASTSTASTSSVSPSAASRSSDPFTAASSAARPPPPAARRRLDEELIMAAEEGRTERVRELLDAGADVHARNRYEETALHCAARKCRADVVALLLERGADAEARRRDGWTALHYAAHNDHSGRCVSLLVDAGAQVNCASNGGQTPLHNAALFKNEAAVRALLAAGADRAARNREGKTPLDLARSDAVRRLLRG